MFGTAKLFLRTVADVQSWRELKETLLDEFEQKVSAADIHSMLRNRKKKRDENYRQYVLAMQEIATLATIDDSDLLFYIINGIPDSSVNKTLLYYANSISELKVALQKYEKIKSTYVPRSFETVLSSSSSSMVTADKSTNQYANDKVPVRKIKCYNCNEVGHLSTNCQKPKRPKNSCYRCGEMGHFAPKCPKGVNSVQSPQRNGYVSKGHDFEHFFYYSDVNEQFGCKLLTLLDSGSPISFVQEKFIPVFLVENYGDNGKFCGLNNSPLDIIGSVNLNVRLDDARQVKLILCIVKNSSMKYPVILGRDFLKKN